MCINFLAPIEIHEPAMPAKMNFAFRLLTLQMIACFSFFINIFFHTHESTIRIWTLPIILRLSLIQFLTFIFNILRFVLNTVHLCMIFYFTLQAIMLIANLTKSLFCLIIITEKAHARRSFAMEKFLFIFHNVRINLNPQNRSQCLLIKKLI